MLASLATVLAHAALAGATAFFADVTATVQNGSLKVIGTSTIDQLAIDQAALVDPHEFRLTPSGSTTVNGSGLPQTFPGVKKDVRVDLGGGLDTLLLLDSNIPRDLRLDADPAGQIAVTVAAVDIGRDLRVDASDTTVQLLLTNIEIERDLRAKCGPGNDAITLTTLGRIGRDIRFDGGDGSNSLSAAVTDVAGSVTMESGTAGSILSFSSTSVGGTVRAADSDGGLALLIQNSVLNRISVDTGDGDDVPFIAMCLVAGVADFDLGGGANGMGVFSSTFGRRLVLRGKAGDESVSIADESDLAGGMRLSLGDGANQVVIDKSAGSGSFVFDAGSAPDGFEITNSSLRGSLRCSMGAATGGMANAFSVTNTRIRGNLTVDGAGDQDQAIATFTRIDGDVRFRLGDGVNTGVLSSVAARNVRMDAGAQIDGLQTLFGCVISGDLRLEAGGGANTITVADGPIRGNVRVRAGSGDDTLTIAPTALIGGKTKIDLGGGTNSGP